ncbi:MAG: ATP-binding protein, partial [Phycisphaerales bacterium]|nr:ATP-binding protein [Phycisphaerales bacterium]
VVIMAGLPGTGKSALARALSAKLGGAVLDKDIIRAALFAHSDIEYSATQDDFCLGLMLETAGFLLNKNPARVIVIDGRTFSRKYQIDRVIHWAERAGAPWRIIECVCPEEMSLRRIERDLTNGNHLAKNRTAALYTEIRDSFEPIDRPKIRIDTDQSIDECASLAENRLFSSAS